jgi:hypothetical protein
MSTDDAPTLDLTAELLAARQERGALRALADRYADAIQLMVKLQPPDPDAPGCAVRLWEVVEKIVAERAALMAAWPGCNRYAGPVLYHHSDETWWLETLAGDRWSKCPNGPYPTREAAIRAAAGLTTEPRP